MLGGELRDVDGPDSELAGYTVSQLMAAPIWRV